MTYLLLVTIPSPILIYISDPLTDTLEVTTILEESGQPSTDSLVTSTVDELTVVASTGDENEIIMGGNED
jgi:hypothetical protein